MRILAIETSCDETAAAVVESPALVRSSAVASQTDLHAEYGGVVPEIASRAHVERIMPIVRRALRDADAAIDTVDAVAVTNRPGLIGALLVGSSAATALAWSLNVPVVGVQHIHAHLYAPLLADHDNPDPPADDNVYPALGLALSGGHSTIYRVDAPTRLTRLGGTIDDAIGEAFDKAAAILGLGYPGGPLIDQRASHGDDRAHDLPVSRLGKDSLDFSFSGLKTALLYAVRGTPTATPDGPAFERSADDLTDEQINDFCASFQRAASAAVILKAERAIAAMQSSGSPPQSILLGGGVAANSRIRRDLDDLANRHGIPLHKPAMRYCIDNAAMIGGLAIRQIELGDTDTLALKASPTAA